MKYLGEYTLKIENGKVRFPWNDSANKIWLATESIVEKKKTINYVIIDLTEVADYISEKENYEQNFKIQCLGNFVLESDNLWEVPGIILKHLKTDDIIFCGVGSFVEVMSVADMENYKILLCDLEEALKKAANEEGFYDEHTK